MPAARIRIRIRILRPGLLAAILATLPWPPLAAGGSGDSRTSHRDGDDAAASAAIIESTRVVMGVQASLRVALADEADRAAAEVAMRAAWNRLAVLEQVMSDYRTDSELSRLNRRAGEGPVAISPELAAVLRRSAEIAAETGGAFDVTVGPLVDQWRATRRTGRLAGEAERRAARRLVGPDLLRLDASAGTAELLRPGMRLDLGGIGKGRGADAALAVLRERGFPRALVSIAGDVAAGDPPSGRGGWRVAAGRDGEASPARLVVANAAVSTSGDSSQVVEVDGRRYAHLVDPRTGLGASVRRAVTVLAPDAGDADALASALFLLGPEAARPIVRARPGTAARFFEPADDGRHARVVVLDPHGAWADARRSAVRDAAGSHASTGPAPPHPVLGIPVVELDRLRRAARSVVGDREPDTSLGHPRSVPPEDGSTMLAVHPQGHGRGAIVIRRSSGGGLARSGREAVRHGPAPHPREPGLGRLDDGRTITIPLRENRGRDTGHPMPSRDELATWAEPRPPSLALAGDRPRARRAPGGRLVVSLRDPATGSPAQGARGAWDARVGTCDGMLAAEAAASRMRLRDDLGELAAGRDAAGPARDLPGD